MAVSISSSMLLMVFVLYGLIHWNRLRAATSRGNDTAMFEDIECTSTPRPQIYFTISSLASTSKSNIITQRLLEVNWYNINSTTDDTIAIYDHDPSQSLRDPLDTQNVSTLTDNFYRSKIQFPVIKFTQDNLTSNCLGYWAVYLRSDIILTKTCVRAQPFWMSDNRKFIGQANLTSLMIPGTHDSGSYSPYEGRKSENVISRYMFSQDEDIFTQFCFGIRHVDLRVAHYEKTKEKFWINHSVFRTNNPLATVISDIKRFISMTKDEILILDFHRFPVGFKNDSIHTYLIETLVQELGDWMIPNSMGYSSTVNEIMDSGKRILVAYSSKTRYGYNLLWPEVKQKWGDEQEVPALEEFFKTVYRSRIPAMLWATMAELTPTSASIFFKPNEGLRFLADKVNRNVSKWFQGDWGWKANIVATDYFLGNHVVESAIHVNKKKMYCMKSENDVK